MTKYQLSVVLPSLAVLACLAPPGCRQPDPEGHARAKSKTILVSICKLVYMAESNTDQPPPTTLPSLVTWLEEHASKDEPYINYQQKTIKDTWGNVIVVVSQNDRFVGVGSPGPNRTWQNGTEDDLLVKLEEVK